jgi:hypothetical protein
VIRKETNPTRHTNLERVATGVSGESLFTSSEELLKGYIHKAIKYVEDATYCVFFLGDLKYKLAMRAGENNVRLLVAPLRSALTLRRHSERTMEKTEQVLGTRRNVK